MKSPLNTKEVKWRNKWAALSPSNIVVPVKSLTHVLKNGKWKKK